MVTWMTTTENAPNGTVTVIVLSSRNTRLCVDFYSMSVGDHLEMLGVSDGVDSEGLPLTSPTALTGMIWARNCFETGWIPVKYLLPMDIVVDDNVIAERILRASRVPMAVRIGALPYSPPFSPPVCRHNLIPEEPDLWATDDFGNLLPDTKVDSDDDCDCDIEGIDSLRFF